VAPPPPLASLGELSDAVPGGIPPAEEARARQSLRQASSAVRDAAGQAQGWLTVSDDPARDGAAALDWELDPDDDPPGVPERIWTITIQVAKRDFIHGTGYASETRMLGDWSRTISNDQSMGGKDGIWLTKQERADAEQHRPAEAGQADVINLGLSPAYRRALRPEYGPRY
jgi:hypothetical protein